MPSQLNFAPQRAVAMNGRPSPGAQARFYRSGTTTPVTVYTSNDLSVAHPVPLTADAQGVFPPIWVSGASAIKVAVTDAAGAALQGYPVDPVQLVSATGSAASLVSFSPVTGNATTNVQDALENLTQFKVQALDFGATSQFATADQGAKADAALPSLSYVAATYAQAIAGVDNTGYMTALRVAQQIEASDPKGPDFAGVSTWAPGARVTMAHGLGQRPRHVVCVFQCLVAEGGWSVGAEVMAQTFDLAGTWIGWDATNLYARTSENQWQLEFAADNWFILTPASWSLIMRAWK